MSTSTDLFPITGGCHCGNVRFTLRWPAAVRQIGARQCGCSFCRKHGGIWTSHPDAEIDVEISDQERLSRYRFGTATADFLICQSCGVPCVVVSEVDRQLYAVVNVNTVEPQDGYTISTSSTDFDGEVVGDRLRRRQRNWIAHVRVASD